MDPPFPFRTELKTATRRTLDTVNRTRAEAPYRPAEDELRTIGQAAARYLDADGDREAPEEADLHRWMRHPDERVRAALLSKPAFDWLAPTDRQGRRSAWSGRGTLKAEFFTGMAADADRDGVHWTALMERAVRFDRAATFRLRVGQARKLQPWLETEARPAAVRRLLSEFEASVIDLNVLSVAGCVDVDLLGHLLETVEERLLAAKLSANPNLPPETAAALADHWVRQLDLEVRGARGDAAAAATGLDRMLLARLPVPEETLRGAFDLMRTAPAERRALLEDRLRCIAQGIAARSQDPVPESVLVAVHDHVKDDKHDLVNLLDNPEAGTALLRKAVNESRVWAVEARAAANRVLATDPALRDRLLAARSPHAKAAMIEHRTPAEALDLVRSFMEADRPDVLATALEHVDADALAPLSDEEVAALLQHDDRRVRLAAIGLVGRRGG